MFDHQRVLISYLRVNIQKDVENAWVLLGNLLSWWVFHIFLYPSRRPPHQRGLCPPDRVPWAPGHGPVGMKGGPGSLCHGNPHNLI